MPHGGTILNFPGKESDEEIFIFTRRHVVAFLPSLVLIILMTLLGTVLVFFLGLGNLLSYNQQIMIGSLLLLFMLLFSLVEFFDFYFDLHIVTDRRIIDIDQRKLFSRSVAELLLSDVQDVESNTTGILASIFNFGTVTVQTAGTKPNFEFDQIPRPNETAAIILDLSDQEHRGIAIADRHPEGPVAAILDGKMFSHTADHKDEIPT